VLLPYYFFVANETSPFLVGICEAVFGAEKGWKKNETNRRALDITGFSDLSLLYYKGIIQPQSSNLSEYLTYTLCSAVDGAMTVF